MAGKEITNEKSRTNGALEQVKAHFEETGKKEGGAYRENRG